MMSFSTRVSSSSTTCTTSHYALESNSTNCHTAPLA